MSASQLHLLLTILSGIALLAAVWCWWLVRRAQKSVSQASLEVLRVAVDSLFLRCDSLETMHNTLRSRVGMREIREKRKEQAETAPPAESESTGTAAKARLREEARQRGLLRA